VLTVIDSCSNWEFFPEWGQCLKEKYEAQGE